MTNSTVYCSDELKKQAREIAKSDAKRSGDRKGTANAIAWAIEVFNGGKPPRLRVSYVNHSGSLAETSREVCATIDAESQLRDIDVVSLP